MANIDHKNVYDEANIQFETERAMRLRPHFPKFSRMQFAGKCARYVSDSTDVLPGHRR